MKLFATAAALLLVAGGAGGYMFLTCPGRCHAEPAAPQQVIVEGVPPCCAAEGAQTAAPVAATPAAKGCPATPDCNGPECTPAAAPAPVAAAPREDCDECCEVPPEGCCPDEGATQVAAPVKIEK